MCCTLHVEWHWPTQKCIRSVRVGHDVGLQAANAVEKIEGLEHSTQLNTLHLRDNRIRDLDGYSESMAALQYLNIRWVPVLCSICVFVYLRCLSLNAGLIGWLIYERLASWSHCHYLELWFSKVHNSAAGAPMCNNKTYQIQSHTVCLSVCLSRFLWRCKTVTQEWY